MPTGLVYHNIVPKTGVDFAIAQWAPSTASPDANLIPVSVQSFWLPAPNGIMNVFDAFAGTTLDALGIGLAVTSGIFSQTQTLGARESYVYFTSGDPGITPVGAGANFAGWFLISTDGVLFEDTDSVASATVPAVSRPPDFIIPLDIAATGTTGKRKYAAGRVNLPPTAFKVVLQNNSGVILGAGTTTKQTLKIAPVA